MAQSILPSPENFNNSQSSESNLDSLSLSEQIKQTQKQVDALGHIVDTAMGQLHQAMVQLERLQEAARLGPFYGFINNELEIEL